MTMRAIQLKPDNFKTILKAGTDTRRSDLQNLFDTAEKWGHTYYFLPYYESADGKHRDAGWSAFPQELIDDLFEYDTEKIKTQFVEIKQVGEQRTDIPE